MYSSCFHWGWMRVLHTFMHKLNKFFVFTRFYKAHQSTSRPSSQHLGPKNSCILCFILRFGKLHTPLWGIGGPFAFQMHLPDGQIMEPHTVDGRYPANHLRLVVNPTIYRILYIPGSCLGFLPPTVSPLVPNRCNHRIQVCAGHDLHSLCCYCICKAGVRDSSTKM